MFEPIPVVDLGIGEPGRARIFEPIVDPVPQRPDPKPVAPNTLAIYSPPTVSAAMADATGREAATTAPEVHA